MNDQKNESGMAGRQPENPVTIQEAKSRYSSRTRTLLNSTAMYAFKHATQWSECPLGYVVLTGQGENLYFHRNKRTGTIYASFSPEEATNG